MTSAKTIATAPAFRDLDAMPPVDRAHLALGMLLTLQGHRHRAAQALEHTSPRLSLLADYWRLVLDMARIEQDCAALASPVPLERDIDADLLAHLGRRARAIAATLKARTFADLTGLDMLLTSRVPEASLLH